MKLSRLIKNLNGALDLNGDMDVAFSLESSKAMIPEHSRRCIDVLDLWSDGPDLPPHTILLGLREPGASEETT